MNEAITIRLPSLIHRIGGDKTKQAKAVAEQFDCELKRVRRSRNWQLSGMAIQIQSLTLHLKSDYQDVFGYLIQKIEVALLGHADKLESLDDKLARLINDNANVTLAELMHLTQCTMAEARVARFNADL